MTWHPVPVMVPPAVVSRDPILVRMVVMAMMVPVPAILCLRIGRGCQRNQQTRKTNTDFNNFFHGISINIG